MEKRSPAADRVSARPTAGAAASGDDDLGYEQARDELVQVVARLESGAGTLEESLRLWERGEALAARCQQWLDGAQARLDAVRAPADAAHDQGDADPADGAER